MNNIKNKIAVLENVAKPLRILNDVQIPKLKKGQVLVKIKYSGICGSQIFEILGMRDSIKYIPHVLGHEASGTIIKKYRNVRKVKPGDNVFISWIKSKGKDASNIFYKYPKKNKRINSGKVATFMNYTIVPENCVNKYSKRITMRESVLLGCALPTGAGMVLNQGNLKKKNKILILGLGGVGISSLMATRLYKNVEVYAYDINSKILKKIKPFFKNCTFLNRKEFKLMQNNCKKNHKSGFDKIFETTGTIFGIESSINLLKNSGNLIFASHPEKNKKISIDPFELIKGKNIAGSWGGKTNFDKNLKDFTKIIILNRNLINLIVSKTYNFLKINNAINDLRKKKVLRPIIKFYD